MISMLFGLIYGVLGVSARADQTIVCVGINVFALGLTSYLYSILFGANRVYNVPTFQDLPIPVLSKIPVIGGMFSSTLLVYLAFALLPLVWYIFYRTPAGLTIRAAGEHPKAVETLGGNVIAVRYGCLLAAGALNGLAGCALTIGQSGQFMRRRKTPWRFPGERRPERTGCRRGAALRAVFPYLALVILALAVGMEPLRSSLKTAGQLRLIWPGLEVFRMPPVSAQQESYPAVYSVNVLSNGGSLVFLACLLSIPVLKLKPAGVWEALKRAARQLLFPGVTLLCVLAMAYVMNYAGMTLSIGLPLMKLNGSLFSNVTVIVGVLGCVLTGSVAGSNALFGNLIATVGASVKCNSAAVLAALCGGGALGKLITPQNLAIAGSQLNEAQRREWMPRITKRMFAWALAGLLLELAWVFLLQSGALEF